MAARKKRGPNIQTRKPRSGDALMYKAYGSQGPSAELATECLEEVGAVTRTEARTRYADIEPGISVREGMDRFNHEFFRPGEHIPRRKNEMIRVCDDVYEYNGIVKFVIDMMADFVTQGIQIYHTSPRKEKRYRHWWKKVGGQQVSERLVNLLYRHGVAIVKRNFGRLNTGDIKDLESGIAAVVGDGDSDKEMVEKDIKFDRSYRPGKNRIPLTYTFLNPTTVEAVGGELSVFAGKTSYGLRIPETLLKAIKNAKTIEEKSLIANMPTYITDLIGQGQKMIPLDPDKVSVHFYKKDDWKLWSNPLVASVLKDIILYEKMKDSDKAALDGAIRSVRLWRLGLPEYKIQPGPGAFKKLRDQLLANNGGGGSMDLVWDATLDFKETSTDVYRYLGSAKYEPVLQAIYAGLGIPQSLTGGGSGGMTNNALGLKTLIERLQYARNVLIEFWEREFYLIQRAFGDRQPARLRFDMMTLSDEASEKMIWVQLYDRNIVTTQTMREKFGLLDDIESQRLKREYKGMDGDTPHKLGPFIEPETHPEQMAKTGLQQGTLAPTEVGIKKKPKLKGDKSLLDRQEQAAKQAAQDKMINKGQPGQGRPPATKDKVKRKKPVQKPRTKSGMFAVQARGRESLRVISDTVTPLYLKQCGKTNLRKLSADQSAALEQIKFQLLMGADPDDGPVTRQWVETVFSTTALPAPSPDAEGVLNTLVIESYGNRGVTPSVEDMREMFVAAYALYHTE